MSIPEKHEGWWGGRIFSDTDKLSAPDAPKKGITPEKGTRTETLICKKLLAEQLAKAGKKMGIAVDNGDCFSSVK